MHKGTYADDCIVNRVTQVQSYIKTYFVHQLCPLNDKIYPLFMQINWRLFLTWTV